MFQTVFPYIIRSSKLHIQRQVFVRPTLLPAASLARLAAGSSNGLYVQFRQGIDYFHGDKIPRCIQASLWKQSSEIKEDRDGICVLTDQ